METTNQTQLINISFNIHDVIEQQRPVVLCTLEAAAAALAEHHHSRSSRIKMPATVTPSLSSAQLQSQYDEIVSQAPVLPLSILPRAVSSNGKLTLDAAAMRLVQKSSSGLQNCSTCSCNCDSSLLQLLLTTKLEFHTRAVHVSTARFVCAKCAAVGSCSLLLQMLTPDVGATYPDTER